jgi:hypothetical protein
MYFTLFPCLVCRIMWCFARVEKKAFFTSVTIAEFHMGWNTNTHLTDMFKTRIHNSAQDPGYESPLQRAIEGFSSGLYGSYSAAASAKNVSCIGYPACHGWLIPQVACQTLWGRVNGQCKPKSVTHVESQLLNPTQENVVLEWCDHLVQSETPLYPKTLCACLFVTSGQQPGKNWHCCYIKHHKELLAKLNGLDPKHTKNFNRMTVANYFAKWWEI